MRKINPAAVRHDFPSDTDALMAYMNRARRALEGESTEKQDVSRLAAMVFVSLYVAFERFLSDLFLAYLNRDFSQYQRYVEQRILQSTQAKVGLWARRRTRFDTVAHVKADDLEAIVDPDGMNLTFKTANDIRTRGDEWLAPAHRTRIHALTDHDERLIDTARAVRDFIAHQSSGAKKRMNELLAVVAHGPHNRHLDRGLNEVHNVGSYLKAVFDGRRRVAIYAERLKDIALKL